MPNLCQLSLPNSGLTNLVLPEAMTNLTDLHLTGNHLSNISFIYQEPKLFRLSLDNNGLTNFPLDRALPNLTELNLSSNPLLNVDFLCYTPNLNFLIMNDCGLRTLTLHKGLPQLQNLYLNGNPLERLVVAPDIASLPGLTGLRYAPLKSISVSTLFTVSFHSYELPSAYELIVYPLEPELGAPFNRPTNGFSFKLMGPPGTYTIHASTNLFEWEDAAVLTNQLGRIEFLDPESFDRRFYRAATAPP